MPATAARGRQVAGFRGRFRAPPSPPMTPVHLPENLLRLSNLSVIRKRHDRTGRPADRPELSKPLTVTLADRPQRPTDQDNAAEARREVAGPAFGARIVAPRHFVVNLWNGRLETSGGGMTMAPPPQSVSGQRTAWRQLRPPNLHIFVGCQCVNAMALSRPNPRDDRLHK